MIRVPKHGDEGGGAEEEDKNGAPGSGVASG